jgi:hypothetical protein
VLGVQNGRGYKINPEAEKVIAKHQQLLDQANSKVEVNLEANVERPEVELRKQQTYGNKKTTLNKLRNL